MDRRGRSLRWIIIGTIAVLAGVAWYVVSEGGRSAAEARLPARPDLTGQPAALIAHIEKADRAARAAPTDPDAVVALAMAYHADLFEDAALACYERAIEMAPGDWRPYYGKSLLMLTGHGRTEESARALEDTVRVRPDHAHSWYWLGEIRLAAGDVDGAEKAYRAAIAACERRPSLGAVPLYRFAVVVCSELGLARVAEERGQIDAAISMLTNLLRKHELFASAHGMLAGLLDRTGETDRAEVHRLRAADIPKDLPPADPFLRELALESRSGTFLVRQAQLARFGADYPWAEFLASRAVEFAPDDRGAVLLLAHVLGDLARTREAVTLLADGHERWPDDEDIRRNLSQSLEAATAGMAQAGRHLEAEALLRWSIVRFPRDSFIHGLLGDVLVGMGRREEAIEHLRKALEASEDPGLRTNLGAVYAMLERREEAITEFEKVLESHPDFAQARENLALALLEEGRLEEADLVTAKFVEDSGDSVRAHLSRARYAFEAKRFDLARASLERVLELAPQHAFARQMLDRLDRR